MDLDRIVDIIREENWMVFKTNRPIIREKELGLTEF